MTIPTYDKLMLPLLQFTEDKKEHHISDAIDALGEYLQLSDEERNELLPTGSKRKFDDRVQWAKTYLKKAGLIESKGRGVFQVTERGLEVLRVNPADLNRNYLMRFPEFAQFATPTKIGKGASIDETAYIASEQTPKELIYTTYQSLQRDLAEELLEFILTSSPTFFEKLVIDLLLSMGYGGSLEGAGNHIGKSGDGGLDGFIQEDKLGLDIIYIQAKRWAKDNVVGRPTVQNFVGSLMGVRATKGVLITTSRFSKEAKDYAESIQNLKVILIDGQQLAQLMIDYGVGISVEATYVVKKVDRDYFSIE